MLERILIQTSLNDLDKRGGGSKSNSSKYRRLLILKSRIP